MTLPVHSALTPREAQVLQRVIEGSTTREIAESYGIGHQTVKNYMTVIYDKLGVRGRSQLLQLCQRTAVRVLPGAAAGDRVALERQVDPLFR